MILLVLVTIWIFRSFKKAAIQKGYPGKKWGIYGSLLYLAFGLGLQILVGVLVGLGILDFDYESTASNFIIALVCYALGGLASYILYQNFLNKENIVVDIEDFGKED